MTESSSEQKKAKALPSLPETGCVTFIGMAGAGKTTVLIRLIRQYADLWHNGDRSILPLRINLNAVTEGQTMDDALRTAFNAGFGITTTEDRKRMVFAHAEQLLRSLSQRAASRSSSTG